jgi:hypothetical protein
MAQIPLNTFKTTTFDILTTEENVYTTPAGVTTVVLLAQVANITDTETIYVTANHVRDSTNTAIIQNAAVPKNDSISLLTGKLILQTGDTFSIQATSGTTDGQCQLILSYLETANQ